MFDKVPENEILLGDALERLRELPSESVNCCITSPPYWGLRCYPTGAWEGGDATCDHKSGRGGSGGPGKQTNGAMNDISPARGGDPNNCPKCGAVRVDRQIGLEPTIEKYVENLVAVFREVRRVLRKDGIFWLNLADSYAGSGRGRNGDGTANVDPGSKQATSKGTTQGTLPKRHLQAKQVASEAQGTDWVPPPPGLKRKDLCGIPWRTALALQSDGWWWRSVCVW